jgi:hypothetical protein
MAAETLSLQGNRQFVVPCAAGRMHFTAARLNRD